MGRTYVPFYFLMFYFYSFIVKKQIPFQRCKGSFLVACILSLFMAKFQRIVSFNVKTRGSCVVLKIRLYVCKGIKAELQGNVMAIL